VSSPGERVRRAARFRAERARAVALDKIDERLGRRADLTPPRRLFGGEPGDFERIGAEFLGYFKELGGLSPDHDVMDIGCGVGQMAVPLTGFLNEDKHYEGFDVGRAEVEWCQAEITPRFPNFVFQVGGVREYRFPYYDGSFDFAFATSVFTRMLAPDVEHHLAQAHRVMKPGARLFTTWFLLNLESRARIADADSHFTFRVPVGEAYAEDEDDIEAVVAYEEKHVLETFERAGFTVGEKRYGEWSGRPDGMTWQDVIVATRR
jgi:SAM-dependent methyltransferase